MIQCDVHLFSAACTPVWTTFYNVTLMGATRYSVPSNVSQCQAYCISISCVAIDVNVPPVNMGFQCWIHMNLSDFQQAKNQQLGTNHMVVSYSCVNISGQFWIFFSSSFNYVVIFSLATLSFER